MDEGGQKDKLSVIRQISTRNIMYSMINAIMLLYTKVVKRGNFKNSYHNKNCFVFFYNFVCKMIDIHQTYCGSRFMMYVSQTITLYALNLYRLCTNYFSIKQEKNMGETAIGLAGKHAKLVKM